MAATIEYRPLLDIDPGVQLLGTTTFAANGEYLVGATLSDDVRVWRVADGKQVATLPVKARTWCLAVSSDGKWIAGGAKGGDIYVFDATTYEQVFTVRSTSASVDVYDVDFSPDGTRLVSAHANGMATIWDVVAGEKVQTLSHSSNQKVYVAKYSPQGDRIATATSESVRVWDGNDSRCLVDVKVDVKGLRNVLWHNNHLFIRARDKTIKEIDTATGLTVSEWPVPDIYAYLCIALSRQRKFMAHSAGKTITFSDTTTHTQLGLIHHTDDIHSFALSPDDTRLAIVNATGKKIIVQERVKTVVSLLEFDTDSAALDAWKHGQLADAEAKLSAAIPMSKDRAHHVLASRALVRARLGQWDTALIDAKESVKFQPSVIGYIAMYISRVRNRETHAGCQVSDAACLLFPSERVTLLLIKAVVISMAGEHVEAISRMDDLINHERSDPTFYVVQAYMYLLLGNKHLEDDDYEQTIRSLEEAGAKLGDRTCPPLLIVSLFSGWCFDDLAITIQQRLCEAFLMADRTKEAAECVLRLADQYINMTEPIQTWISDFKSKCCRKLEDLGDSSMNAKQYDEAVSHYTVALSLGSSHPQDLLIKRNKAHAEKGDWKNALNDANEVIKIDSSSPSGYESKYTALLGMGCNSDAAVVLETMLSKMSESSDPVIRERSRNYIQPEQTTEAIRTAIKNAIRDLPGVLIDASSGRLCDKSQQAAAFESTPAFVKLITSMTTHIDHALIEQEVEKFYRYATFSHTWEGNEPLYEKVTRIVVYDLEASPTHEKLKMFCKIVRDEGFNWAWSDTCCIDKGDHFVYQRSLVSMFAWYEGSAMTIIYLCDVDQLAVLGALIRSRWNSRGWTLQEYHASKVVRIYTKDWTPYLGLTIDNHKESPEVISEMEQATGISAEALKALRPGLNDIREKLRLASTRQTTYVEDAAYSLLGIFSMSLPVTYGEGDRALGRLLSHLLTSSGDTSILAWDGRSGSFNSSLPSDIIVFNQPLTRYVPPAITDAEMEEIVGMLHTSSVDGNLARTLYDRVDELRIPTFSGQRMRLPCLIFKVKLLSRRRDGSEFVFRSQAGVLGAVEIKAKQCFTPEDSLYLVHPWLDFLLDRRAAGKKVEVAPQEHNTSELDDFVSFEDPSGASHTDLDAASHRVPTGAQRRAYEFLARLRQPFGALLLASNPRNVAEYSRVATESMITVQVGEITSATLNELIQSVRELDVL